MRHRKDRELYISFQSAEDLDQIERTTTRLSSIMGYLGTVTFQSSRMDCFRLPTRQVRGGRWGPKTREERLRKIWRGALQLNGAVRI